MKKCILSSIFLALASVLTAQNIPLGSWRTHHSYNQIRRLAFGDDKIFCSATNGFYYYDLEDNSLNPLTKVKGLSDVGITAVDYHAATGTLVMGYSSGGIDLLYPNKIKTITDLKSSSLISNKAIYDLDFSGENLYAATELGIIVIDLKKEEIFENYRSIGLNGADVAVRELYVKADTLFAITSQGIQYGLLNKNLLDFNNWHLFEETSNDNYAHLASLNGILYGIKNDKQVIYLTEGLWQETGFTLSEPVISMRESAQLLIGTANQIIQFDGQSSTSPITPINGYTINDFLYQNGEYWLATRENGLVNQKNGQSIMPNGPQSDQLTNLKVIDGELYAFRSPPAESYNGTTMVNGYDLFKGGEWTLLEMEDFPNISDVARWNDQLFFASIGFGLYNATNPQIFNQDNSNLTNSKAGYGVMIPSLVASDGLWMLSYDNANPFAIFNNNTITNYGQTAIGSDANTDLSRTENGLAVITLAGKNGGGFMVYDTETGNKKKFTNANGLPSTAINNITIDQSDNAWVATNNGLVAYTDASFLLDFAQAITPVYENSFLFEDETINYVKTDGGDRVWISTTEGLWVFDKAFSQIEHHFTSENSPLLSNNILQMTYNSENGEMFILTDKGLISYRSNSSAGQSNYEEVAIFPNPVRPGYSGLVGISGLVYDTKVKITDINGKLIRELETNGGTVDWDLLDYNHQKVSSGVYIILTAFPDGSDKFVGKIAVIN